MQTRSSGHWMHLKLTSHSSVDASSVSPRLAFCRRCKRVGEEACIAPGRPVFCPHGWVQLPCGVSRESSCGRLLQGVSLELTEELPAGLLAAGFHAVSVPLPWPLQHLRGSPVPAEPSGAAKADPECPGATPTGYSHV